MGDQVSEAFHGDSVAVMYERFDRGRQAHHLCHVNVDLPGS
jgi:hypothetical protein